MKLARRATAICAALLFGAGAHAADVLTKVQNFGTLASTFSSSYGNTFMSGGTVGPSDTFYDDYAFNVGPTTLSSLTATFDSGQLFAISNLSVRLFAGTPGPTGPLSPADLLLRSTNTIGTGTGVGSQQVINPISLPAGAYVLEIRGRATGTAGGSYAGVVNLSPVPEPSAALMTLAGFGLIGVVAARRRRPAPAGLPG